MGSQYNIGAVARRAGLTAHVLRAWERRYLALRPSRTEGNQRLYTDEDVERLRLLGRLCRAGHRIGRIARSSVEELRALAVGTAAEAEPAGADGGIPGLLARCRSAVEDMDGARLGRILDTARVFLPPMRLVSDVILPLMRWVGDRWESGKIRILHEHIATAVVRSVLDRMASETPAPEDAPLLAIATPPGEWHEVGALAARLKALECGWRVLYLGANIPAAEVAEAAVRNGAAGVALGITVDADRRSSTRILKELCKALNGNCFLLAAGPAAVRSAKSAGLRPAAVIPSLAAFGRALDRLRSSHTSKV